MVSGEKINEFINELRINDAIEKLKNTDNKILDIALDTGFDSLSTFNRAFKHFTGTTPREYREKILGKTD